MFLQISKVRKKIRNTWHLQKQFYKDYKNKIEFKTQNEQKTKNKTYREKQSQFSKLQVKKADFYKPILNNIMTTYK